MRIVVIGAGHAGVEAASTAAAAGADVTLFSAEPDLPYFRPRLVACAFGQAEPESIAMHPEDWYRNRGISLYRQAPVTVLDLPRRRVVAGGMEAAFDAAIIATGATPFIPASCQAIDGMAPLWNSHDAAFIRQRLISTSSVTIIGGGVIGVEAAVRAAGTGREVILIEKMNRLMARNLTPAGSAVLSRLLETRRVKVLTGVSVQAAEPRPGPAVAITLDDGRRLTTGLAIVSIGARLDTTMAKTAGLAVARGVRVDEYLRTSDTIVFACGDIAELEQPAACSARRATNQGRIAGSNAKAASGPPWLSFREKPVPLDLKCGDFELHVAGVVQPQEPATEETSTAGDCQEVVLEESSDVRYRSRIVRHGVTIGIQMVGTGKDIARYANEIGAA